MKLRLVEGEWHFEFVLERVVEGQRSLGAVMGVPGSDQLDDWEDWRGLMGPGNAGGTGGVWGYRKRSADSGYESGRERGMNAVVGEGNRVSEGDEGGLEGEPYNEGTEGGLGMEAGGESEQFEEGGTKAKARSGGVVLVGDGKSVVGVSDVVGVGEMVLGKNETGGFAGLKKRVGL